MAIKAMPHTISSMHHAVILRSRHLDGTSAKPAASAPPRPGVNGSALICQWQPRHRGSTSPCECFGSLLGHALNGAELCCTHLIVSRLTSTF